MSVCSLAVVLAQFSRRLLGISAYGNGLIDKCWWGKALTDCTVSAASPALTGRVLPEVVVAAAESHKRCVCRCVFCCLCMPVNRGGFATRLKFIVIVMSPFTIYLPQGPAISYIHSTICSHVCVTMHSANQVVKTLQCLAMRLIYVLHIWLLHFQATLWSLKSKYKRH